MALLLFLAPAFALRILAQGTVIHARMRASNSGNAKCFSGSAKDGRELVFPPGDSRGPWLNRLT